MFIESGLQSLVGERKKRLAGCCFARRENATCRKGEEECHESRHHFVVGAARHLRVSPHSHAWHSRAVTKGPEIRPCSLDCIWFLPVARSLQVHDVPYT